VDANDLRDVARWAQRRALKRTVARHDKRALDGRVMLLADRRSAGEQFIQASRWLFEWLTEKKTKVDSNIARKVKLPTRQEQVARSLDPDEFIEV
jgi:site-specific recombinase XerC